MYEIHINFLHEKLALLQMACTALEHIQVARFLLL